MNKGMLLLLFFFLLCSFSRAQYVTLEGRQFKDENGNDFYPVVCNFSTEYLFTSAEPFFPSPGKDHDGHCYDCNSFLSCLDQFSDNFEKIKEMNFNAIRLYMINPVYFNVKDDSINGWALKTYDYEFLNSVDCWTQLSEKYYTKPVYLSQTFGPDTVLDRILLYYDSVLLRAARSSLKVLLNVGVAKGDFSYEFIAGYGTYLALVADHFGSGTPVPGSKEDSIRKTILAYVILEEPSVSWKTTTMWPSVTTGHSKQDVCQFISSLYDTLKLHDPHHLVTLGGVPYDLFEFDPGVMKLDFYSPHIYTQKRSYMGAGFFQGMLDEAHSWFYWMANNAPMPYLIGETGFKSKYMDDNHPANQGTNWQQKLYADSTLKSVKDCKGSGYSWWYYQDYYWGNPHEGFFGLLGRRPGTNQTEEKPVVAAFETFNPATPPGTMTKPASYYDPYHHAEYAPDSNIITGYIVDTAGSVKDAWIRGTTYLGFDTVTDKDRYDNHYTFSDENGNFTLIPFDYDLDDISPNVIVDLKITCPSGLRFNSNWNTPPSVATYCLMTSGWKFDQTVANSTIKGPGQTTIQAFNSLDLQDVYFLFRSECDVTARTSVSLHSEVVAYKGSETHIFCGPTYPDCTAIPDTTLCDFSIPVPVAELKSGNAIELAFLPVTDSITFTLYPNPCKDVVVLELVNAGTFQSPCTISVYNSAGACVASFRTTTTKNVFSLASLSAGIYLVQINYADTSFSKTIIKSE